MLISAVGSAFNEERTAALTIHSLVPLADEIILVDNGCTDNTVEEATRQVRKEKANFKVVDGRGCSFLHDARHKGFKEAQGEWILVYDLDHYFNYGNPEWQRLLERLEKSRAAEVFHIAPSSLMGDLFHRHRGHPYMAPHTFIFRNTDKVELPDITTGYDWPILPKSVYSRPSDTRRWALKNMIWNLKCFEPPRDLVLGRLLLHYKRNSGKWPKEGKAGQPHYRSLAQAAEENEKGILSDPEEIKRWTLGFIRMNAVLESLTTRRCSRGAAGRVPPLPRELDELRWERAGVWHHSFPPMQKLEWIYDKNSKEIIGRWPDLLPPGREVWGGNRDKARGNEEWIFASDMWKEKQ